MADGDSLSLGSFSPLLLISLENK
ncbi:hypothetical protein CCACVL1_11804 [Corchorus capsularis]|uniref:Uncharacterized protein n=1 Tax=Corchorus capsularis TaxID=210143 RepID=A0A1R3IJI8_COCAP|nr:hypothetical protein CCACVL1_11804 [Corchorus capsularis]